MPHKKNTLQAPIQALLASMVPIQGGRFTRGSDHGQPPEYDYPPGVDRVCDYHLPVHEVQLSDFQIGKYLVTQAQWKAVMGALPSFLHECPHCPVTWVNRADVAEFLARLNAMTGRRFDLPTEAQWEYAARGGQAGALHYAPYAGGEDLDAVAWHLGNAGGKPHPVGQKAPNALGLYDLSGNVEEWCRDSFNPFYYQEFENKRAIDPQGPPPGDWGVLRGGSYGAVGPLEYRVDFKSYASVQAREMSIGFRLVVDA